MRRERQPFSEKKFVHKCNRPIQKKSHYLHERKKFSVADMLFHSFIQEELQLN